MIGHPVVGKVASVKQMMEEEEEQKRAPWWRKLLPRKKAKPEKEKVSVHHASLCVWPTLIACCYFQVCMENLSIQEVDCCINSRSPLIQRKKVLVGIQGSSVFKVAGLSTISVVGEDLLPIMVLI